MAVQKIWQDACKSWVNEEGILYHSEGIGSAPSKDFYILDVSIEELIMQVWKVTNPFKNVSRESVLPKKYRCSYEDFRAQHEFRGAVERYSYGELQYLDNLITGQIDYLCRMNRTIQIKIINNLDMKDLYRLMRTNKHYKKLCGEDEVWRELYLRSSLKCYETPGLIDVINTQGWKFFVSVIMRVKKVDRNITRAYVAQKIPPSTATSNEFSDLLEMVKSMGNPLVDMTFVDEESELGTVIKTSTRRGSLDSSLPTIVPAGPRRFSLVMAKKKESFQKTSKRNVAGRFTERNTKQLSEADTT